jgi:hypothetical protein
MSEAIAVQNEALNQQLEAQAQVLVDLINQAIEQDKPAPEPEDDTPEGFPKRPPRIPSYSYGPGKNEGTVRSGISLELNNINARELERVAKFREANAPGSELAQISRENATTAKLQAGLYVDMAMMTAQNNGTVDQLKGTIESTARVYDRTAALGFNANQLSDAVNKLAPTTGRERIF